MTFEPSRSKAVDADSRYDERRAALAPYRERLGEAENGPLLHPAIMLDSWELSALEEALGEDPDDSATWPALLAETIAFQTKYHSELSELEGQEYTFSDSLEQRREEWTVCAAIGLALMDEIQQVIDATILAGNMGEAKKLTGFRNKLSQTVKEIKDRIGKQAFSDAESMHHEMLAPRNEDEQENLDVGPMQELPPADAQRAALREPDEETPKPIKLNRYSSLKMGRPVEEMPDHLKRLLVVLGIVALAWLILVLPRMFREPLPVLTLPDLPQSAAIQQVDAKPPSLYIIVNDRSWKAIPREQRLQWIEQIGQVASDAGYTGANIRTSEGLSVGQWLKLKGARLVVNSGGGS
jgi:hypothetical protein